RYSSSSSSSFSAPSSHFSASLTALCLGTGGGGSLGGSTSSPPASTPAGSPRSASSTRSIKMQCRTHSRPFFSFFIITSVISVFIDDFRAKSRFLSGLDEFHEQVSAVLPPAIVSAIVILLTKIYIW